MSESPMLLRKSRDNFLASASSSRVRPGCCSVAPLTDVCETPLPAGHNSRSRNASMTLPWEQPPKSCARTWPSGVSVRCRLGTLSSCPGQWVCQPLPARLPQVQPGLPQARAWAITSAVRVEGEMLLIAGLPLARALQHPFERTPRNQDTAAHLYAGDVSP